MVHIEIVDDIDKVLKDITPEKMMKDPRNHVIFMTPKVFCHVFSPERLKLIMYLKNNKVESISELARKLGRKFEAVHRDIRYLDGIVKLKKNKQDMNKVPYIQDGINIKMASAV